MAHLGATFLKKSIFFGSGSGWRFLAGGGTPKKLLNVWGFF